MIPEDVRIYLVKFLNDFANAEELDVLNTWLEDEFSVKHFEQYIKAHYVITVGMNEPGYENIKKRLQREIRADKTRRQKKRFSLVLKSAAVMLLFVGLGYFFINKRASETKEDQLTAHKQNITLELENGEVIVLDEKAGKQRLKFSNNKLIGYQNNGKLSHVKNRENSVKPSYATLNIPYGKRFDIILSDGTKVFLNSGSSLRYPLHFIKNKNREVSLDGEAFFDVAHDKTRPFNVEAEEVAIKVLGTKFNLTNYQEDASTEVVLTNGSVNLDHMSKTNGVESVILTPGMKGSFNRNSKDFTTQKVNTTHYTSWLQNSLIFRDATFKQIIKKLERTYDVVIINNHKSLLKETFNATIEYDKESVIDVFEYFKRIHNIEYQVYQNKIIIE